MGARRTVGLAGLVRGVGSLLAALTVALAVLLARPAAARAEYAGFADVGARDWYVTSGDLDYAVSHGLLSGYADGDFGPQDPVSRAQVATILWRAAGSPAAPAGTPRFPDCDYSDTSFYGEAVAWARAEGVVTGYQDGTFGPADSVTREQLAAMLSRHAALLAGMDVSSDGSALAAMADAGSVSAFAREALAWCVDEGILTGDMTTGAPHALPQGTAQRDQAAKMISVFHREVLGLDGQPPEGVELAGGVSSVSSTRYELLGERSAELSGEAGAGVSVGDVIVLAPSEQNPGGSALRVTQVTRVGDGVRVSGVEPDLSEVASSISFDGASGRVLSVEPGPGVTMVDDATGRAELMASSESSVDLVNKTFTLPGDAGTVKVKSSLDFSFDYSWGKIHELSVSVDAEADLDLSVSDSVGETVKVASLTLSTPVWGVAIDLDLYLSYSASGEASFWAEASADAGVTYDGSWDTHLDHDFSYGMSFDGQARAGVEPSVMLDFLSIGIVDASAEVGGALEGAVERRESGMVCCDAEAYLYVSLGVGQHDSVAKTLGLSREWDLLDEDSSAKAHIHVEDGQIVPECTWGKTRGIYGAFLDKVRELEGEYGEGRVVRGSFGDRSPIPADWLDGVCFVDVVDFGDGVERLVTVRASGYVASRYPNDFDAYVVDVWGYDDRSDEALLEWSGNHSASNGAFSSVDFCRTPDGLRTYLVRIIPDANYTFVGVRDDGSFGVVHTVDARMDGSSHSPSMVYTMDGRPITMDQYWGALESLGLGGPSSSGNLSGHDLAGYESYGVDPSGRASTLAYAREKIAWLERQA